MKRTFIAIALCTCAIGSAFAGDLKQQLIDTEKTLWTAWGAADPEPFRAHLTADATNVVAGAGVNTGLDAMLADIAAGGCTLNSFEFTDVVLKQPVSDVAILSYTATQDSTCDGHALPPKVYATSIYVQQDGVWKTTHYQETPAE